MLGRVDEDSSPSVEQYNPIACRSLSSAQRERAYGVETDPEGQVGVSGFRHAYRPIAMLSGAKHLVASKTNVVYLRRDSSIAVSEWRGG